jgi:hypothetical protein
VRDFNNNWIGDGTIINPGVADTEALQLGSGQSMTSEIVQSDKRQVEILYNTYDTGDNITLEYRHGLTDGACQAAGWNTYTGPFISLGFIQVRVTN